MTNLDDYFLEGFDCADCQENTFIKNEYYMLHDKIWCSVASKFETTLKELNRMFDVIIGFFLAAMMILIPYLIMSKE